MEGSLRPCRGLSQGLQQGRRLAAPHPQGSFSQSVCYRSEDSAAPDRGVAGKIRNGQSIRGDPTVRAVRPHRERRLYRRYSYRGDLLSDAFKHKRSIKDSLSFCPVR
ncbi:hypothetical protein AAFF_G00349850 [Aldrovandia affinis]|uniref:Uncharacterized protein n=1 Tax=Aldrovandia affinis TaxID=143900 RepID=A0AAD7SJE8_9TELE|nr:hypothetical protein AAFF_G00349850 [Aldrovandia affinis]